MITNIKSLLNKKAPSPADAERMPPDDGMRYRRDMLHQSIRESMLAMEVLSTMYKFKVVNVDPQYQVFIALIEVSKLFEAKWNGVRATPAQIERRLITGAMNRTGVTLQSVFWRVDETVDTITPPASAGAGTGARAPRQREIAGDVSQASQRLARRQGTSAAAAPASDSPAPPAGSEIGGTQYGQL